MPTRIGDRRMRRVVVAEAERCSGCRVCELICSLTREGECNPFVSAIHRQTVALDLRFEPETCKQCADAPCGQACPTDAIAHDPLTGGVVVDTKACTACGACVEACPFGQIRLVNELVVKCDLCGGEPLCVTWCPRKALSVLVEGG